jgi:hypothetical protein
MPSTGRISSTPAIVVEPLTFTSTGISDRERRGRAPPRQPGPA